MLRPFLKKDKPKLPFLFSQPNPAHNENEKLSGNARRLENKKKPSKRAAQKILHYEALFEDGICHLSNTEYSIAFELLDINYQIARRDEQIRIFTKWCEFYNSFDDQVRLQIICRNRYVRTQLLKEIITIPDFADQLNYHRHEYNEVIMSQAVQGQNGIQREKHLIITFSAKSYEEAILSAGRLKSEVTAGVKAVGGGCRYLSGIERCYQIASFFEGDYYQWSYIDLLKQSLTTKDFIAPDFFDFKKNDQFKFVSEGKTFYGKILYFKHYPPNLSDAIMSDFSNLPFDITVSQHILPVDPEEALDVIQRQIASMDMEVENRTQKAMSENRFSVYIPFELQRKMDQAKEFMDDLQNKNQQMFRNVIFVYTAASSQEDLNKQVERIMQCARKRNCRLAAPVEQQELALNAVLPIGRNDFSLFRTLNTAATAVTLPFSAQDMFQKTGLYYGINAVTNQIVFIDRRNLMNPSGFFLGVPGSGKSFKAKEEIISVLMKYPEDDVIIIDPEREFSPLANEFGGEVITISSASTNHLNPMDISDYYSDADSPVQFKSEFLLSLFELLSGKRGLSDDEKGILDRVIRATYEIFYQQGGKKEQMPTLQDFYEILQQQPEDVAQRLCLSLELYIKGSLSVFAHQTNVQIDKRFVVYDTCELNKQLKALGLMVVLDQIWNRITANKTAGRRTWIYTDEFYLLFADEHSANYYYELYKRARKWGAIPTGITQNVTDLLRSQTACTMLSNAEFVILMNQSASDRVTLSEIMNISERQMEYVTDVDSGEGLIIAGKNIIPFVDKFPKDTKLYHLMSTKFQENATI